jgi:hypothetical protein
VSGIEPETTSLAEAKGVCGANTSSSSSSSELKELAQSKLEAGGASAGKGNSESRPPEAADGNDKDPSPSTITAVSHRSPSDEREAAGGSDGTATNDCCRPQSAPSSGAGTLSVGGALTGLEAAMGAAN